MTSPPAPPGQLAERLVTPIQLADQLNLSTFQLAQWRHNGTGPQFIKVGRLVRYRAAEVDAWLEAQTRQPGAHRQA